MPPESRKSGRRASPIRVAVRPLKNVVVCTATLTSITTLLIFCLLRRRCSHYCLSGRARWKDRKWKWRKEPTKEHETAVFRRKMGAFFFALLCFALRPLVGWLSQDVCRLSAGSVVPSRADQSILSFHIVLPCIANSARRVKTRAGLAPKIFLWVQFLVLGQLINVYLTRSACN